MPLHQRQPTTIKAANERAKTSTRWFSSLSELLLQMGCSANYSFLVTAALCFVVFFLQGQPNSWAKTRSKELWLQRKVVLTRCFSDTDPHCPKGGSGSGLHFTKSQQTKSNSLLLSFLLRIIIKLCQAAASTFWCTYVSRSHRPLWKLFYLETITLT